LQIKPRRPCVFCGKLQTKLKKHILHIHRDLDEVKAISTLRKQDINAAIDKLRKAGIYNLNVHLMQQQCEQKEIQIQSQRVGKNISTTTNTVISSKCKAFIKRKYFIRHARKCGVGSKQPMSIPAVVVNKTSLSNDTLFHQEVVKRFVLDEVGKVSITYYMHLSCIYYVCFHFVTSAKLQLFFYF
jgi:hypothetical protein